MGKRNRRYDYKSHDVRLFMGDLNFRVDLEYEVAKVAATNFRADDLLFLTQAEQLSRAKKTEPEFENL